MLRERLLVVPPASAYSGPTEYVDGFTSYAAYNYLRHGPVAHLKRQRFEMALRMASGFFGGRAVDMGCADGVFLPSLAKHFREVVGVDRIPGYIDIAERAVTILGLANVRLVCSEGLSPAALKARLGDADVMFLLETLEHVGTAQRMYESKMDFLASLFDLLPYDAVIVASVPVMVGLPLLAKYAVQTLLRMHRERLSAGELLQLGVLRRSDDLEQRWTGDHVGFNHLKLERAMKKARFRVLRRRSMFFSVFYVLAR